MTDDTKPVPEPGEADRDESDIHYFQVDETNVGKERPDADEPEPRDDD